MVPDLRDLIEQALIAGLVGLRNRFLDAGLVQVGTGNQLIGLRHIGIVMLLVMKAERVGRVMRLQRVVGVGQGGKFECHVGSLRLLVVSGRAAFRASGR